MTDRTATAVNVLLAAGLLWIGAWWCELGRIPRVSTDSHWYIEMARGRVFSVPRPFCNRVLHPIVVCAVADTAACRLDAAFRAVAYIALAVMILSVAILSIPSGSRSGGRAGPWIAASMAFSPGLLSMFGDAYLPDLFHAGLAAVFLLAFRFEWQLLACLAGFMLGACRESTLLLAATAIAVSFRAGRRGHSVMAAASMAAGVAAAWVIGRSGAPNIHGVSALPYMFMKTVFNGLENLLGVELWTNTLAAHTPGAFPHPPVWHMDCPAWLPSGSIRSIGVAGFDPWRPVRTFSILLTLFGAGPAIILSWLRAFGRTAVLEQPGWMSLSLLYGVAAFAVTPMLGPAILRLGEYAWTAFWVWTPVILAPYIAGRSPQARRLLLCHAAICWLPPAAKSFAPGPLAGLAVLAGAALLQFVSARYAFALFLHGKSQAVPA